MLKERAHFESLSDKEKTYYQAYRLALMKKVEQSWTDKNNWWNKIAQMKEEEIDVLPNEYLRKFGTFILKTEEMQKIVHLENNKDFSGYNEMSTLDRLKTKAELDLEEVEKQRSLRADMSYQYELEGYMKRQPRVDLKKDVGNYNYEQFREYTALYEDSKKKDQEELRQFYKMVKYSRLNQDKNDKSAIAFAKKYRLDLIEIPPEFQEESLEDISIKKDKRTRRPVIRMRTSRDISKYDAWRNYDRQIIKGGGKHACVRKLQIVPADMVKAFGLPSPTETGFQGTGEYHFEDSNLDCFNISEYKKTDFYYGLERPEGDLYYESKKNLAKVPHKREKRWPTIEQFWTSSEPQEFRLSCQDQADFRKFRVWIRKVLAEVADKG